MFHHHWPEIQNLIIYHNIHIYYVYDCFYHTILYVMCLVYHYLPFMPIVFSPNTTLCVYYPIYRVDLAMYPGNNTII
jgi:hypothetical protein